MSTNEAILAIHAEFNKLGYKSVLMGATARDLIAEKYGIKKPIRQTADVDFAILIESWEDLKRITEELQKNENIEVKSREKEKPTRFYYKETPFDLVPFGKIEKDHQVSWPPFYDTILTVLGYREALSSAIEIEINQIPIPVVSPDMLIALKLIAWNENRGRAKDLTDIHYLLSNYETIEPQSYASLLDEHTELLEKVDFQADLAAPLMVGIRIKRIAGEKMTGHLISILESPETIDRMIVIMAPGVGLEEGNSTRPQQKLRSVLSALLTALNHGVGKV